MLRTPWLIFALVAAPVAAQSSGQIIWQPGNQSRFNAADCADPTRDMQLQWPLKGGDGGIYDIYAVYRFEGNCDPVDDVIIDQDPDGELIYESFEFFGAAEFLHLPTPPMTLAQFLPNAACATGGSRDADGQLCFHIYDSGFIDPGSEYHNVAYSLTYDTSVPEVPALQGLVASDGQVSFSVGAEGDAGVLDDGPLEFLVQLRACDGSALPAGFAAGVNGAVDGVGVVAESGCNAGDFLQQSVTTTTISIAGLSDLVDYELRVFARDDFANLSEASAIRSFSPVKEVGPLGNYEGGGTPYSCSQAGGTPFYVGGLLLLFLAWRRRKSAVLVAALLVAAPATAAPGSMTADLWVGPHLPDLDREAAANGLYKCFFSDQVLPEIGADFVFSVFDAFGSLQFGLGVSASQVAGGTFDQGELLGGCGTPTEAGRSQLSMLRVRPHGAYRFDWLLDEFNVPLVPYGELGFVGLGYTFTRNRKFDDGGGANAKPVGAVFGWEATLGLALELSFLDALDPFTPNTAKRARARGSFLHPFFFAEFSFQEVDNFGGGGFVFSPRDTLLSSGLPMMMRFGVRVELP